MQQIPKNAGYLRVADAVLELVNQSISMLSGGQGMRTPTTQRRKLASILYADMYNYTGHCEQDEEGTHTRLIELMDLFAARVMEFEGRIAHSEGDALLAEFSQVMHGLDCAITVQRQIAEINLPYPVEDRIEFRIGLNMGDVICDRGDIYGNVVNVAARLESLADPGGITVSDTVRVSVGNAANVEFISLGEQTFKNIHVPMRVYRVALEPQESPAVSPENVLQFPIPANRVLVPADQA